nr:MAG TPA: hypothetical protein [Caudoviricetes sp.]
MIDLRSVDDFLDAIWYACLIGLEYIRIAWTRWQNI